MIFTGTNTEILLDTGTTLTGATVKVRYQKPDGTTGEWTGSVSDTTKVKYETAVSDFDEDGRWFFQASVTLSGKTLYGNKVSQVIYNPISI